MATLSTDVDACTRSQPSEELLREEGDRVASEAPAPDVREQRDPDLADARREAILRGAGLDVADQAAVHLDREVQEAPILECGAPLDLLAQLLPCLAAGGRERGRIIVVRGDQVVDVGDLEGTEPNAGVGGLAHATSLTRPGGWGRGAAALGLGALAQPDVQPSACPLLCNRETAETYGRDDRRTVHHDPDRRL